MADDARGLGPRYRTILKRMRWVLDAFPSPSLALSDARWAPTGSGRRPSFPENATRVVPARIVRWSVPFCA